MSMKKRAKWFLKVLIWVATLNATATTASNLPLKHDSATSSSPALTSDGTNDVEDIDEFIDNEEDEDDIRGGKSCVEESAILEEESGVVKEEDAADQEVKDGPQSRRKKPPSRVDLFL